MKIIRTLLILSVGVFFLPSPPESQGSATTTPAVVSAAVTAAGDVGSFCQRQPTACSVAGALGNTLEEKLRYSIKLVYEWANGPQPGPVAPAPKAAPQSQGSLSLPFLMAEAELPSSQNTLKLEDLLPEWRDPNDIRRG